MDPLVERAPESLAEVKVAFAEGKASLGVNRRNNRESEVLDCGKKESWLGRLIMPFQHCRSAPGGSPHRLGFWLRLSFDDVEFLSVVRGLSRFCSACFRIASSCQVFFGGMWGGYHPFPRRQEVLARRYGDQLCRGWG